MMRLFESENRISNPKIGFSNPKIGLKSDGRTEATTGSGYFGRISVRVWPALDVALQICLLESAGALGEYAGSYPHLFTSGLWK